METIYDDGTPLANYLEGEGYLEPSLDDSIDGGDFEGHGADESRQANGFAPSSRDADPTKHIRKSVFRSITTWPRQESAIKRIHDACSTAFNSRLGRADNAHFLEHFRYIIVASQLLSEYVDQGSLPPTVPSHAQDLDGAVDVPGIPSVATSLYGATATAAIAFTLVYLIHWARGVRDAWTNKSRILLVLAVFLVTAFVGYGYIRRQWLKFLRRNAVAEVTALTANWQAFEVSSSSALALIQEVELVSKGYRLSTPLPPASRVEDHAASRRCTRLRKSLHKAYTSVIPACIATCDTLRRLTDEDDLEKYFEVYDINAQDAREAAGPEALSVLEDDGESLKSLRVFSYRASVLRRVMLCHLMALEADGGKPDFHRWRIANEAMDRESQVVCLAAEKLQQCLSDMETVATPIIPANKASSPQSRDRMRGQVRKISMLSSGIRSLQAKMQILREETNRSIEQSEDLTDLGPNLLAQYESIGADLKDLMQAWEAGKSSLHSNLTRQERRISRASSIRSPVSSIGGLTAVEEYGGPDDALMALTGASKSHRSSLGSEEEEVFEAVALPKRRSAALTREERVLKMHEERERQAVVRASRDASDSMLKELQTVINLRPKKTSPRITSV